MLLFEKLDEIRNLNTEVNGMLSTIENDIKSIMLTIKNKSDFMLTESDFVYKFDRQDEYNMKYLFDLLLKNKI